VLYLVKIEPPRCRHLCGSPVRCARPPWPLRRACSLTGYSPTGCHHERRRQHRGHLLHRRAATQRPSRSVRGCTGLAGGERLGGRIEVLTGVVSPELLLVDPMTAFDFAVLFGALRADVAHANAESCHDSAKASGKSVPLST
jgi:hypothetical protein